MALTTTRILRFEENSIWIERPTLEAKNFDKLTLSNALDISRATNRLSPVLCIEFEQEIVDCYFASKNLQLQNFQITDWTLSTGSVNACSFIKRIGIDKLPLFLLFFFFLIEWVDAVIALRSIKSKLTEYAQTVVYSAFKVTTIKYLEWYFF